LEHETLSPSTTTISSEANLNRANTLSLRPMENAFKLCNATKMYGSANVAQSTFSNQFRNLSFSSIDDLVNFQNAWDLAVESGGHLLHFTSL
jgi:hypothetical protein